MLRGLRTAVDFDNFLKSGLCKLHKKESEIKDDLQSTEMQRKALLYVRLQVFSPLLYDKPFSSDKIKTVLAKSKCFLERESASFKEAVMILDSVMVYTLCYLGKICCCGALFKTKVINSTATEQDRHIHHLLHMKTLDLDGINYFNSTLQENFSGCDENFIKIGYITTLLFVRNITMQMTLKQAINGLEADMQNVSKESEKWKSIAYDAYKQQLYEEAINAYSSALNYNPFNVSLLSSRAQVYFKLKRYEDAILDYYLVVMFKPHSIKAYSKLAMSFLNQASFYESYLVAEYAMEKFKDSCYANLKTYKLLQKIFENAEAGSKKEIEKSSPESSSNEEETEIPDLIEASDSEYETQDVPDLMDASNSEESDSEAMPSNSISEIQASSAEKEDRMREKNTEQSIIRKSDFTFENQKVRQLNSSLKEASLIFLEGCSDLAVPYLLEALNEIKCFPQFYKYEECDIACVEYAYGSALCKSKSYEGLQKAICVFKELVEEHKHIPSLFPATYYGLGMAYYKLNCFKDAKSYLNIALTFLNNHKSQPDKNPLKIYNWPGTTTPINETNCEHLKNIVDELIKECDNPPPPNAMCRFDKCSLRPSIYYTDPDFKGFYIIQCSEHCCLQYHPQCWRILRSSKHRTDKAFLEQKCFTPDCEGIITKIQSISKEENIEKTFLIADAKKLAKPKKTKLLKKLENKEEKKRRRKDSTSRSESTSEVLDEMICKNMSEMESDINLKEIKMEEMPSQVKEKEENSNVPVPSQLSANAEPFIVLKKEKLVDEHCNKASAKGKEHKKAKTNTLSINEFLQHNDTYCSEYEQRLIGLRENNENIIQSTWINCNKRDQIVHSSPFGINSIHPSLTNGIQPIVSTPPFVPHTFEAQSSTITPSMYDDSIPAEVVENVKSEIYTYMRDMLLKYGPLRIDAPILIDELKDFPPIANKVIADCDGIGGFLKQNFDFAVVGDTYICLVADVITAYEKYNKESSVSSFEVHEKDDDINDSSLFKGEISEMYHSSHLNPDAKEYLPPNLPHVANKVSVANSKDEINRNSPGLISAISKLRQPLAVDAEINSSNNEDNMNVVETMEASGDNFSKSYKDCLASDVKCCAQETNKHIPGEMVFQVLKKCTDAVKMYFSNEMKLHHSFIDQHLKPYRILEMPEKNVYVQTENTEVLKESKGTMKTDEELQRLKEIVTLLHVDKRNCMQKLKKLEEEHTSCVAAAVKCQKESDNEIATLRNELEDAKLALQQQKEEFEKQLLISLEENRKLLNTLVKTKETNSNLKSEIDQMLASRESMKNTLKKLEENVEVIHTEKNVIRQSHSLQLDEFSSKIKILETENRAVLERAKHAEQLLLCLKKTEFLKRIDNKALEGAQRMKQLQDWISIVSSKLNPVSMKNLEVVLIQIKEYLIKLQDIRTDFLMQIDEQMNKVVSGIPLNDLKPIHTAELPEIPSFTSFSPNAAFSAQVPCWSSQVQILNAACNSADANSISLLSGNNLPVNSEAAGSKMCQSTLPVSVPVNIANSAKESEKSVPAPAVKKLPPGISSYAAPQFLLNSQSLFKPQMSDSKQTVNASVSYSVPSQPPLKLDVGGMAGGKLSETEVKTSRSSLHLDTNPKNAFATVPTAIGAGKSERSDVPSSLELDYNVQKAEAKRDVMFRTVSQENLEAEPKTRFGKLLQKLSQKFPAYRQAELMDFVKEIREKTGKLSGLSMETIVKEVGSVIEAKKKNEASGFDKFKSRQIQNVVFVNKKLVPDETQPKDQLPGAPPQKKCPWAKSDLSKHWSGGSTDEECTICCEDMTSSAYKVDCGHSFHFKCIQQWLSKKSDCPICRVHLLLPDDYPALK